MTASTCSMPSSILSAAYPQLLFYLTAKHYYLTVNTCSCTSCDDIAVGCSGRDRMAATQPLKTKYRTMNKFISNVVTFLLIITTCIANKQPFRNQSRLRSSLRLHSIKINHLQHHVQQPDHNFTCAGTLRHATYSYASLLSMDIEHR